MLRKHIYTFCLILDLFGNFHLCRHLSAQMKIKGYAKEKLTDNLDIRRHILSRISIYILQKVSPLRPFPTLVKNGFILNAKDIINKG